MSSLREKRYYPVLFMLILTIILTTILALSYELSKDRVRAFRELSFKKELIGLFKNSVDELKQVDLNAMNLTKIDEIYKNYVTEMNDSILYYKFMDNDKLIGYCYPLEISGLWGKITLLAAIDSNKEKLIGISITEQNETPGLGGRIVEDWFQSQFSGKIFKDDEGYKSWKLVGEDIKPQALELRQVSGATISSRAVSDGLINELKKTEEIKGEK